MKNFILALLPIAALAQPPSPPGFHLKHSLISPKAKEQLSSWGKPMSRTVRIVPRLTEYRGFYITNIVVANGTVHLGWQGGSPPYQIEGEPNLDGPWGAALERPTMASSATFQAEQNHFWRLLQNQPIPISITSTNPQTIKWETPTLSMSDSLTSFVMQRQILDVGTTPPVLPIGDPNYDAGWDDCPSGVSPCPISVDPNLGTQTNPYVATDPMPPPSNKVVYYRPKEITANGVRVPYGWVAAANQPIANAALVWEQEFTGTVFASSIKGTVTVVDPVDGTILVAGPYSSATGTMKVGGVALPTTPLQGVFLARFNPDGTLVWVKGFGSASSTINVASLSLDSTRNIIMSGDFTATVSFGGATSPITSLGWTTQNGAQDAFIVKFDTNGVGIWAQRFGSDALTDTGCNSAMDAINNIYFTFFSRGQVDFGGGHVYPQIGTGDILFAKVSGVDGSFIDAKRFGRSGYLATPKGVKVAGSGAITVCGQFNNDSSGPLDFGNGVVLQTTGASDGFAVQFSSAMIAQWGVRFGSTSANTFVNGIALDSLGNVALACQSGGTVTFTGTSSTVSLSTTISEELFVKYSASGSFVWGTAFTCTTFGSSGLGVAMDSNNNPVFCGFFSGIIHPELPFNGQNNFPNGRADASSGIRSAYWVRCNGTTGAFQAGRLYCNSSSPESQAVAVSQDSANNNYVTGFIKGSGAPMDFGPDVQGNQVHIVATSPAQFDGFLLKLTP